MRPRRRYNFPLTYTQAAFHVVLAGNHCSVSNALLMSRREGIYLARRLLTHIAPDHPATLKSVSSSDCPSVLPHRQVVPSLLRQAAALQSPFFIRRRSSDQHHVLATESSFNRTISFQQCMYFTCNRRTFSELTEYSGDDTTVTLRLPRNSWVPRLLYIRRISFCIHCRRKGHFVFVQGFELVIDVATRKTKRTQLGDISLGDEDLKVTKPDCQVESLHADIVFKVLAFDFTFTVRHVVSYGAWHNGTAKGEWSSRSSCTRHRDGVAGQAAIRRNAVHQSTPSNYSPADAAAQQRARPEKIREFSDLQARLYSLMNKYVDMNCTLVVCCHSGRRRLDTVLQEMSNTQQPIALPAGEKALLALGLASGLPQRRHVKLQTHGHAKSALLFVFKLDFNTPVNTGAGFISSSAAVWATRCSTFQNLTAPAAFSPGDRRAPGGDIINHGGFPMSINSPVRSAEKWGGEGERGRTLSECRNTLRRGFRVVKMETGWPIATGWRFHRLGPLGQIVLHLWLETPTMSSRILQRVRSERVNRKSWKFRGFNGRQARLRSSLCTGASVSCSSTDAPVISQTKYNDVKIRNYFPLHRYQLYWAHVTQGARYADIMYYKCFPRPFIPALLHTRLTSSTLTGSQDLHDKSRPDIFTNSHYFPHIWEQPVGCIGFLVVAMHSDPGLQSGYRFLVHSPFAVSPAFLNQTFEKSPHVRHRQTAVSELQAACFHPAVLQPLADHTNAKAGAQNSLHGTSILSLSGTERAIIVDDITGHFNNKFVLSQRPSCNETGRGIERERETSLPCSSPRFVTDATRRRSVIYDLRATGSRGSGSGCRKPAGVTPSSPLHGQIYGDSWSTTSAIKSASPPAFRRGSAALRGSEKKKKKLTNTTRGFTPMRVEEELGMDQHRNEGVEETGNPRENPSGIVRPDSHLKTSGANHSTNCGPCVTSVCEVPLFAARSAGINASGAKKFTCRLNRVNPLFPATDDPYRRDDATLRVSQWLCFLTSVQRPRRLAAPSPNERSTARNSPRWRWVET
ncbi:hypothetical protein PR048_032538 [Dryococelus australis]|uniref:Uncharacterized protein n=1 Tax=Dryococelus australis TaxID=614101 RepID=A0ABQ9G2H3_9NEOP|nr:hypothetical protein PR048_032538 [Dryococelus australis]